MSGSAFERYVAPARTRPGIWRLLIGLVLIVLGWLVWTALVMIAVVLADIHSGTGMMNAVDHLGETFTAGDPLSIALMLLTFFGIWPSAWAVAVWLQRRPFGTLISPERRVRWRDFGIGVGLGVGLWTASTVVGLVLIGMPERSSLAVSTWAFWLVPMALLVTLQASGEELIFRGYLLQGLAALSRRPLVWAVIPALLFGAAHFEPGRGPAMNAVYVGATLVFGLIGALLVWRTGSLSASMGLHSFNNFGAICLTGLKGVATGSQLWVYGEGVRETLIFIDLALMSLLLVWLASPACPRVLRTLAPDPAAGG